MASQHIQTLSAKGDAVLVAEEGDVLRAYRCPAGTWTIGTGLTAASGVVRPAAGMLITAAESARLRRLALARNYEPGVVKTLPTESQSVFDGGVLFHFNTGAIGRASWVGLLLAADLVRARPAFLSWNRGAGKVLAGLVARRAREWNIIEFGVYGSIGKPVALSDFALHADDFKALGYDPTRGAAAIITAFQRDHGLTVDGKIGPATRATILRAIAARRTLAAAGSGAVGGAAAGGGTDVALGPVVRGSDVATPGADTLIWAIGGAMLLAAIVALVMLAWSNRGPLFAFLPEPVKDWFEARGVVLGRRVRT